MTIDIHCHLLSADDLLGPMFKGQAGFYADGLRKCGKQTTSQEVESEVFPTWIDPDASKLLRITEDASVDKTCILVGEFNPDQRDPDGCFGKKNLATAQVVNAHPDRLIAFCGVSPHCHNPVALINEAVQEYGMQGIKLDPLAGKYALDDDALDPIYRRAAELGLPILTHTGPRPESGGDADYAHPSRLSRPLARFPSLNVIAAHMSFAWWRDLVSVGQTRPNLLCDISALQLTAHVNPGLFRAVFRKVLDGLGSHRVFFGSDGPPFDMFISRKEWVRLIGSLPTQSPADISFTEEEIDNVLDGNARRLLGLGGEREGRKGTGLNRH